MTTRQEHEIKLADCRIQDGFWSYFQDLVKDVVIPYQERILKDEIPGIEKSHAIENFRIAAGESGGEYYGMVFQDSDVAKWLEAAAYSLQIERDPGLEKRADEVIALIGRAQQEDGYLNTYFTVKEPEHRWQNLLECHELYCAGHMMEAAVAYYESTGKDELLNIMCRMADLIDSRFGPGKLRGIPGHEEVELALLRLSRVTGEERYKKLAEYFINERGTEPNYFEEEVKRRNWCHWGMNTEDRNYGQNYAPVRKQDKAVGHSVRAMYLYTGMADLAGEINDQELYDACLRLWDSTVNKQMYVTGGIGSSVHGEAFTRDYDLPNDTIYAETCASVGLVFFARKLLELNPSRQFADVMERALYNGVLSGMQHDGKRFFYVNPLEVVPGLSGKQPEYKHVVPERPQWYACACCPPNVSRLLTSLPKYAWGENENTVYSHLYMGGTFHTKAAGGMTIETESGYPWNGTVNYRMQPDAQQGREENGKDMALAVRIPGWCRDAEVSLNDKVIYSGSDMEEAAGEVVCRYKEGYLYITKCWKSGDTVTLNLDMQVKRVYANTKIREDAGRICLMRGPLVYCLEQVDNGENLQELRLSSEGKVRAVWEEDEVIGGYTALLAEAVREVSSDELYSEEAPAAESVQVKAIPYYLWGNRGPGEMRVWIPRI